MKKVIAIISALAMTASMALTAGAVVSGDTAHNAEDTAVTESGLGVDIKASATANTAAEKLCVGADQSELTFTYTGAALTWNPETLTYSEATAGEWSAAQTVNVYNYSNVALNVTAAIGDVTNNCTMEVDKKGPQALVAADTQGKTTVGTGRASSVAFQVTPGGTPTAFSVTSVATMTLTFTK